MSVTLKCSSCNIVIDELLAYVQNKISLCDEESLVRLCAATFSGDEIEKSKSLLFESLPVDKRKPVRKGQGKVNRALSDIISVFKSHPDLMPVFVARNLERLPPITFDHVDVSDVLKKLVILQEEVRNIKDSYASLEQLEIMRRDLQNINSNVSSMSNSEDVNFRVNTRRGAYKSMNVSLLDVSDQLEASCISCMTSPKCIPKEHSHVHNINKEGTTNTLHPTLPDGGGGGGSSLGLQASESETAVKQPIVPERVLTANEQVIDATPPQECKQTDKLVYILFRFGAV